MCRQRPPPKVIKVVTVTVIPVTCPMITQHGWDGCPLESVICGVMTEFDAAIPHTLLLFTCM